MSFGDNPSKSMIILSNYLMKRRKWPYRGWHKRFFILQNGYMIYGKSEQDVKYFVYFIKSKFLFSSA
jgi:hypothetical protein